MRTAEDSTYENDEATKYRIHDMRDAGFELDKTGIGMFLRKGKLRGN